MRVQRGDTILVNYPFASGTGGKVRPALVVQCDRNNGRLDNTIIAQITSRTRIHDKQSLNNETAPTVVRVSVHAHIDVAMDRIRVLEQDVAAAEMFIPVYFAIRPVYEIEAIVISSHLNAGVTNVPNVLRVLHGL